MKKKRNASLFHDRKSMTVFDFAHQHNWFLLQNKYCFVGNGIFAFFFTLYHQIDTF